MDPKLERRGFSLLCFVYEAVGEHIALAERLGGEAQCNEQCVRMCDVAKACLQVQFGSILGARQCRSRCAFGAWVWTVPVQVQARSAGACLQITPAQVRAG